MNVPENQKLISIEKRRRYVHKEYWPREGIKAFKLNPSPINEEAIYQEVSAFPRFKELILHIIKPGTIRRVKFHKNINTGKPVLVFDVNGYKYCSNLGKD